MSEIGLGLAALGRPAYINLGHADDLGEDRSPDGLRAQTHTVLDHAYAAGVRYFDAARSYGLAEEFLGGWLRECDPDGVFIASKWGYMYTAGWRIDVEDHEIKDLTAGQLRRQLAETREHLGSWLRLYQIHSATIESGVLEDAEVLGELAALRETGVQIGLTATGTRQSDTIDAAIATGAFDAVQATWNLHERSATAALAAAHDAGLGVIIKEALANGRLTARGAPDDGPLVAVARRHGTTPDALALAAVLAQPWVDVVLSGVATVDTLRSNLAALDVAWDAQTEEALAPLAEPADEYWERRSELAWN
jgi:aryl-alcohol dehydrogenase-like predicted oxidoreductase